MRPSGDQRVAHRECPRARDCAAAPAASRSHMPAATAAAAAVCGASLRLPGDVVVGARQRLAHARGGHDASAPFAALPAALASPGWYGMAGWLAASRVASLDLLLSGSALLPTFSCACQLPLCGGEASEAAVSRWQGQQPELASEAPPLPLRAGGRRPRMAAQVLCVVWKDLYSHTARTPEGRTTAKGPLRSARKARLYMLLQAKPESSFTVGKHPQVDGTQ
eukprot:COSAG01_NODE_2379_length_7794_cov_7.414295_11_plen_222_part_00